MECEQRCKVLLMLCFGYTCEFIEERSCLDAVSVVSHSIGKCKCALFIHEKIASQLKHVRREAQKSFTSDEELQVSPIE